EEGQKVDHCAHHGEKLVLFCQQDGNVICWLCERSQEHRGHQTFLVEEVAQKYREKLQVALEMMRQKQKDAETECNQVAKRVPKAPPEEKEALIARGKACGEQTQSVRVLISDLEHRLQGSVMELLQGVDGVIKRIEKVTLQ
uniref:TRIM5/cyclophilin A V4 fusion protein n=1 Tax=Thermus thermophilus (strain ATCC BAA-163 / DSM 7039 / HB27) TaxID=262724 RepID=UPI000C1F9369|nr:Chain A, TRIM5/cyclophilin A V4 fusion protein [synthetic construct]